MSEPTPTPEQPTERDPKRVPSTLGGLVYLVLGAVLVAGLLVVVFGSWRRGVSMIGVGLIAAAVGRGVLHDRDAGMLGVRSRWFDVATMVGVGVALIVLAASIPDQPR